MIVVQTVKAIFELANLIVTEVQLIRLPMLTQPLASQLICQVFHILVVIFLPFPTFV